MQPNSRLLLVPLLALVMLTNSGQVTSEPNDLDPYVVDGQMTPLEEAERMLDLCQRAISATQSGEQDTLD